MVGLQAFGESAWELEQVMNHWRAQSLVATPELLALVRDGRELLSEWSYALQGEADPGIEASGIATRAREMRGEPSVTQTPAAELPVTPLMTEDFMTIVVSGNEASAATAVTPAAPIIAAPVAPSAAEYMTLAGTQQATIASAHVPAASAPLLPSAACEEALADLGDRLSWLGGLVNEMQTEATVDSKANIRLKEIAHMMQESMSEARALHRTLNDYITKLKNST